MKQQRKAQKTWAALTLAHVRHQSDWADILRAIVASGVPAEELRSRFGIPPSTFSRWWTGASEPARMLRTLLEREIAEVAEKIAKSKG
jgi:transposase-like protein